jgi:uncharacterized membrane protein YphA (DoxX/SURF4 family)
MKTIRELNTGLEAEGLQGQVLLFARLLLAPLFVYSGIGKILAFGLTASRLPGGEGGLGSLLAWDLSWSNWAVHRPLSSGSGHGGRRSY